ncbi:hypothetical protein [Amycolatopsis sp. MJM2582]|uniref:hypothetical protein n=1 Tax=Amycolatopsis sp. MJM2582 TaxID=1427749 RepID=UPI001269F410|nr:hypothetical protein [Amycolatopsis sp. MJM2582]
MTGKRELKQNPRLQWYRVDRGWSRSELARQLNRSIASEGDRELVGYREVTEQMVKSWETRNGTSKFFAKHLCMVLNKSASELGLLTDEELALRPADPRPYDIALASGMVNLRGRLTAKEVVPVLAGGADETWRSALQAAGVPLDVDQDEVLSVDRRRRATGTDPKAVAAYAQVVAHQRTLYWTSQSRMLLHAAQAHMALGSEMLSEAQGDEPVLAAAVAECALLVARLAFFDLDGFERQALNAFRTAEAGVAHAKDHSLAVAVAAHQAFVPGFDERLADARPFLVAAERQWRNSGHHPLVRAWLHCVSAEIYARNEQVTESRRHLKQAEDYLAKSDGTAPLWMDFFDSSRFAGFAGNTALLAGRFDEAIAWLQQSLESLGADSGKQRSVLLLDLAAAHASKSPEHAVELAIKACDQLEQAPYRMAVARLPRVHAALSTAPTGRRLVDRTHELLRTQLAIEP